MGCIHKRIDLRPTELYGISGSKGHGKDTFARLVLEAQARGASGRNKVAPKQPFVVAHFAGALKRMSARIFGLTDEQMHDPVIKEAPFKAPLLMDMFLQAMRTETGLDNIQPAGMVAHSPREVMQYFGTEYVRRTQDNYWIQRLLADVHDERRALVPDTRFINEAKAVWSVGGRIIKVVRIDAPPKKDGHASETEMDAIEPDLLIGVRTGDLSLPERIANLIALGKFEAACRYDYRSALKAMEAYVSGKSVEESAAMLGQAHKHPYALYNLLDYYGVPRRKQAGNRVPHKVVEGETLKRCSLCGDWKAITDFNASSKAWDGLASLCRICAFKANKSRYQKYSQVDSLAAIFATYRPAAIFRGLSFELGIEDFRSMWENQAGRCWYTGIEMTVAVNDPNKVSIDRLDSTKGYTRKNTVLCTKRVNLMKREMSVDEFRSLVGKLHEHMTKDKP